MPVLLRVFPQGLEPRDPAQAKALRAAYEEWQDNPTAPGKQRAWLMHVLTAVLGYPQDQITEGQTLPAGLEASLPEMGETLRPDFALVGPTGSDSAGQAQLLIANYPSEQALDKAVIGKHWKATPATRMMELLHGAGVPLGLVTNGELWMLVYAPRGETTGYASWYGALWLDEPITLRAFHSLLGVRRFFGVAADNTLLTLLKESASDQQEVTDQLGYQVREAVEVLVQSFDALDKESNRELLKGVSETDLYDAALTVMMRLVFLFSAEERGLLHLGEPIYDNNYAVSTLQEQLQEVADSHGEEVLERRYDAWARLLATFRAVHGGIRHQDLLMQAYGGSLFDPDRYPFLEGRTAGSAWRSSPADPLSVNNRVALHLLNSLQRLRSKTGGVSETRRVSFRALGVEQIGHVYEGLLDHTGVRANEPVLGIKGTRKKEPEIPLATLEGLLEQGQDKLIEYLKEETGRSVAALRRTLDEGSLLDEHKLLIACDHDETLLTRLRLFAGLIREDSFERPLVVLTDSVYVTSGSTRRSTGTHYTPPSLTHPVVQHTLEPLIYEGPAEGWPREQWKLKSPKEILDLKICDMAMGSGAFLVQVCRYLAERLVEAWENEERKHPGEVLITPDGKFSEGSPSERLVPADTNERIAIARRVVADRCLYGVDINPMAVEMAKLSIWLITVDANRPFTFLDHAFKCGDSLLGITSLEQLENFSLRPGGGKQQAFATLNLWRHIDEAKKKREALELMPSDTPEQIAAKAALYAEAEESVAKLNAAADVLVAVELKGFKGKAYESEREASADYMMSYWAKGLPALQDYARQRLEGRHCLHWALAFPEIIGSRGFDAFVGNPPFVGGRRIRRTYGLDYLNWLTDILLPGASGNADLCSFFFRRTHMLLARGGVAGLIATNTIAEGDTRTVGLEGLYTNGATVFRAVQSAKWPGTAALEVAHVWYFHGEWNGQFVLDGESVTGIDASLGVPGSVVGRPKALLENMGKSFQGSIVLGQGFVLDPDDARNLINKNPDNATVLFPYLRGEDFTSHPEQKPSTWVINFFDWPLDRSDATSAHAGPVAADYPDCLDIVERLVRPERTRTNERGDYVLRKPLPQKWWIYADKRPALYRSIQGMERVLFHSFTGKYVAFNFVLTGQVFAGPHIVFAFDQDEYFVVLQSSFHDCWVWEYCSTMEARIRYANGDLFDTFPFPRHLIALRSIGAQYQRYRQEMMVRRQLGLTGVYNAFHDLADSTTDIIELRHLHVELDQAVAATYGWQDLDLGHGFHETKQGIRYTISEAARLEVLDRLLELNHQRHAEEVAAGLHEKKTAKSKAASKRSDQSDLTGATPQNELFSSAQPGLFDSSS